MRHDRREISVAAEEQEPNADETIGRHHGAGAIEKFQRWDGSDQRITRRRDNSREPPGGSTAEIDDGFAIACPHQQAGDMGGGTPLTIREDEAI